MLRRGFLFMAAPLPSGRWLVGSVVQEPGRFVPEAVGVVLIEGVRVDSARAVARL